MYTTLNLPCLERNPLFSFQPIDVVCDPCTIAGQRKMVSVTQAFAVDLSSQVIDGAATS
jgi:acyl-CoA hydrolase